MTSPPASEPAGIEWTLVYSPADIVSISAAPGPAAAAAGKSIACASAVGSYTCLLTGIDSTLIANGAVALITVTLSPYVTTGTTISLTNTLGASLSGNALPLTGTGATVTITSLQSLTCAPAGLSSRSGMNCTVALSQAASSNTAVALSDSNSAILTVPGSVVIPAGSVSASFTPKAATVSASQIVTITAALGASTRTASVTVFPPLSFSSLACTPASLVYGSGSICTVAMNRAVAKNVALAVSTSNSAALIAPASVTVLSGASSATFSVTAGSLTGQYSVTVSLSSLKISTALTVTGAAKSQPSISSRSLKSDSMGLRGETIRPVSVSCSPRIVPAGLPVSCEVQLSSAQIPAALALSVSSSSPDVRVPASITTRPGQSTLNFVSYTSREPKQESAVLEVSFDGHAVQDRIMLFPPAGHVSRDLRPTQSSRPPGPARPEITALVNAAAASAERACSPGSIASLVGRDLLHSPAPASDPSRRSAGLAGARVIVNRESVPVLYASPARVDFLCPELPPGTALEISLETESRALGPYHAAMRDSSPGIFTVDGSGAGQGLVFIAGSSAIAAVRNPSVFGQPAQPGDTLRLRVTGVPPDASVLVRFGDVVVPGSVVQSVPGLPGVSEVLAGVPAGVVLGDAVPVQLQVVSPGPAESNVVTVAMEPVRP